MRRRGERTRPRRIAITVAWVLQGAVGIGFLVLAIGVGYTLFAPLWGLWLVGTIVLALADVKTDRLAAALSIGVAVLLVEAIALPIVFGPVQDAIYCGPGVRAILAEFPQYRGVDLPVHGDSNIQACIGSFSVPVDPSTVIGYYRSHLTGQGWFIVRGGSLRPGARRTFGTLIAVRGQDRYSVSYLVSPTRGGPVRTLIAVGIFT